MPDLPTTMQRARAYGGSTQPARALINWRLGQLLHRPPQQGRLLEHQSGLVHSELTPGAAGAADPRWLGALLLSVMTEQLESFIGTLGRGPDHGTYSVRQSHPWHIERYRGRSGPLG